MYNAFSKSSFRNSFPPISGLSNGFTLIELLVVIAIVALMSAATIFVINPPFQLDKSKDAQRKADLKLIQSGLELYRSDQGSYPSDNGQTAANCPSNAPTSLQDPDCTSTTYLQNVPDDPATGNNYFYCVGSDCPSNSGVSDDGYALYACLENKNDNDKLTASTSPAKPTDVTDVGCTTGSEVYGVINP